MDDFHCIYIYIYITPKFHVYNWKENNCMKSSGRYINCFLSDLIITKKKHFKNIKKSLDTSFKIFFNGILVISIYILFFFNIRILNCSLVDLIITKKNYCENTKKPLNTSFKFFAFNGILFIAMYFQNENNNIYF